MVDTIAESYSRKMSQVDVNSQLIDALALSKKRKERLNHCFQDDKNSFYGLYHDGPLSKLDLDTLKIFRLKGQITDTGGYTRDTQGRFLLKSH